MLRIESSGDEDSHQWEWLEGIDDKKEDYLWGKVLGQGSFGAVRMVKNKQTEMRFAAKLMSREQMDREGGGDLVEMECKVLEKLSGTPFIIQMDQYWADSSSVFITTEVCSGGELLGEIKARCEENTKNGVLDKALPLQSAQFYLAGK
jgi:serine/threonine protein kinase